MTNVADLHPPSSKPTKTFRVRRTVILHDVQEFIVTNVADEFEAQDHADAMIASYSSDGLGAPPNVKQVRSETIDPGECNFWYTEEARD